MEDEPPALEELLSTLSESITDMETQNRKQSRYQVRIAKSERT
jgi:hypothetical protein